MKVVLFLKIPSSVLNPAPLNKWLSKFQKALTNRNCKIPYTFLVNFNNRLVH